ncbi:hypothetical protein MishRS11D_45790 (plasmid) [Methylomagnum ishizawai]|nr:hypothetical protein MishRS11D_45790 [Methylomagnum ishizawai]
MDKDILEAIRGAVREAVKEEIGALTEVVTDGFEYLIGKVNLVDKSLGVIESHVPAVKVDMEALKMDVTTVKREIAGLKLEFVEAMPEIHETRTAMLRIEHVLQDKQEAHGDELEGVRQRIERIEDSLRLPHTLSTAA